MVLRWYYKRNWCLGWSQRTVLEGRGVDSLSTLMRNRAQLRYISYSVSRELEPQQSLSVARVQRSSSIDGGRAVTSPHRSMVEEQVPLVPANVPIFVPVITTLCMRRKRQTWRVCCCMSVRGSWVFASLLAE